MLRRDVLHALRFPMMTISGMLLPVLLLLLFVGVFGHALAAGLGAAARRTSYIDYLAPGILVMTAGFAAEATAVSVCTDMPRGHHRPLPHDGDLPRVGADRPGRREH